MTERRPARVLVVLLASVGGAPLSAAHADVPKRACVEASTEGQTLRGDDRLLEARDELLVCANDSCPSVVKTFCAQWLGEVEAQIPSVIVRVRDTAGDDVMHAEVTIDGHPGALGRPEMLDSGEHVVTVSRPSGAHAEKRFLLVDGDRGRILTVELPVEASDSAAGTQDRSIPVGAWALGGAGLVAFGSFALFAVEASDDLSDLRHSCSPRCAESQTSTGRRHATIADISLGVGIAATGGAVVWALLGSRSGGEKPAPAAFDVHPTPGGAVGTLGFRF